LDPYGDGEGTVMRRILVVDDDPHICLAVRVWLKRYGFTVTIADGGITLAAVAGTLSESRGMPRESAI
jgi:CheY-like chemotaxis protein